MPPKKVEPQRRKRYTDEDMHLAILAARDGETVAGAARKFGVPRVTLMDKLAGRSSEMCKIGRKPVVGEEEERVLARWILQCRSAGFPVSMDQLIYSTQKLLAKIGKSEIFPNGAPTRRWVDGFLRRHPELSVRECQNLTTTRANVTVEKVKSWFEEVKSYISENHLENVLKDTSRVFNCDETAFFLCPDKGKVIVGRGDKSVYRVSGNNEKENVTVLLNCCADGSLAPSMVVFPYDRWPPKVISSIPDEWGAGKTESGWMTSQSFFEYIGNVFEPYLTRKNISRPVILFMDGHSSHMSLEVSELCSSKGIELIALLPNATHILQPLDVAVFHPLKVAWRKAVTQWRFENGGRKLKNENFSPLVKQVVEGAVKPESIQNGFKTCGLLTLDTNTTNLTKLIGEQKNSKSSNSKQSDLFNLQRHLFFLESKIEHNTLKTFQIGNHIQLEDTSLFKIWQDLKSEIEELKKNGRKPDLEEEREHIEEPELLEGSEPFEDIGQDEDSVAGNRHVVTADVHQEDAIFDTTPVMNDAIFLTVPTNVSSSDLEVGFNNTIDHEEDVWSAIDNIETDILDPQHPSSWNVNFWEIIEDSPCKEDEIQHEHHTTHEDDETTKNPDLPATPHKKDELIPETTTNTPPTDIPSPFKDVLMWPERNQGSSSKRKKIKTPSVVTSKLWKDYHHKIKEEKTKKEEAAAERKAKREEKMRIKMEEDSTKKNEKEEPRSKKFKLTVDEESEFDYADDVHKNMFDINKCCLSPIVPESFKAGHWVVVPYTNKKGVKELFIGQVLAVEEDEGIEVKFLCKKGNQYLWPIQDDIDVVPKTDIVSTLEEPVFDRRGYLTFQN